MLRLSPARAFVLLRQSILPDPDAPVAARASQPGPRRGRLAALLPRLALGAFLLMLAAAVGVFAFRQMYGDRIYPSVVVAGVEVGGLTPAEAETRLAERAAEIEQGTITFTYGNQSWTPTLQELGATVDLSGSTAAAMSLGRDGDAASRLAFTGAILDTHQQAPLQMRMEQAVLNAWFDRADQEIGLLAVNASIVIEGDAVVTTPEQAGQAIDRDATTAQILTALSTLQPTVIELPLRSDEPAITEADLAPVVETVEGMVAGSIRATFEGRTWNIEGATVAPYLLVELAVESGKPVASYRIDTDGLASALRLQFGEQLGRAPVDAVLGWDEGVVLLEEGKDGVTLKATPFAEAVAQSFLGDHEPVDVPVLLLKPRVDGDNYQDLGINELLGQGDSNFAWGVAGRDENVQLATEYLNHTLVPPGEEFSYNDAIGEITAERGFQEALVVQGEGVGRDVGGGVCQVSTTVFRAALLAGMPITEWYQHTFRLPNYEYDGWAPGFDASILQWGDDPAEWPDFQFENYTGRWLLVQAYVVYPRVYVNIFGTSDGRTVALDPWTINELSFGFTRTIYDANGNVLAERGFVSHFQG